MSTQPVLHRNSPVYFETEATQADNRNPDTTEALEAIENAVAMVAIRADDPRRKTLRA